MESGRLSRIIRANSDQQILFIKGSFKKWIKKVPADEHYTGTKHSIKQKIIQALLLYQQHG